MTGTKFPVPILQMRRLRHRQAAVPCQLNGEEVGVGVQTRSCKAQCPNLDHSKARPASSGPQRTGTGVVAAYLADT